MIITCPECSARFVVKAEAIGEKGRKVKCAKCSHKWFQEPDKKALDAAKETTAEPKETEALKEGANVPAKTGTKTPIYYKIALAASVACLLITITIISANSVLPSMGFFYNMFGIYDAKEIALYDIEAKQVESGKYQDLVITGKIVNESERQKQLPNLRIVLYDEENSEIKSVTLDSEGASMQPGEAIDFENRIPRIPNQSTLVVLDIGNTLDLASR